jgi:hypothetical protein
MSDVDSPPEPAETGPQDGQEPSAAPKNSPEARINGLMSVLGRRTTERDEARREAEELRQRLDTAFVTEAEDSATNVAQPLDVEPKPEMRDDDEGDDKRLYTLAEARDVIEAAAPVGHIDANNPERRYDSRNAPGLAEMRRALDAGWSAWQHELD